MLWERQAERMQRSHAGSVHSEGRKRDSRAQEDAPDKQERRGRKEVKELKEEERAGTRLMIRPCRMHKARTRDTKRNC